MTHCTTRSNTQFQRLLTAFVAHGIKTTYDLIHKSLNPERLLGTSRVPDGLEVELE